MMHGWSICMRFLQKLILPEITCTIRNCSKKFIFGNLVLLIDLSMHTQLEITLFKTKFGVSVDRKHVYTL